MTSLLNKFGGLSFILFYSRTDTLCRFANRSTQFISAYRQGLSSAQAAWANKKYHGHCTLPSNMVVLMKETIPN